jgi:hypothetical protein
MSTPGFTAETSLYRTSASYRGLATSSDRLTGGIITDRGWTSYFGGEFAWLEPPGGLPFASSCDVPGSRCCPPDASVKTRHCHKGLGCNTSTDHCEVCGGPGQVCCDGDFTGFSRKSYTGFLLDPAERIESCNPGARCDASPGANGVSWIGTRRCQPCGNNLGGACCAPDNRYALGRCFRDARSGNRLVCNDPWAGAGGNCVECGKGGQPKCLTAGESPCDNRLVARGSDGICIPCGQSGLPTCHGAEPCWDGHSVPNRSNTECIPAGGSNQPCRPDGRCDYQGLFCNSRHICQYYNNYPNPGAGAVGVGGGGLCGANGQIPCGTRCNQGLILSGGKCVLPGCAAEGVGCHSTICCAGLHCNDNEICQPCLQPGESCSDSDQCCGGGCGVFHGQPHKCTNCARLHGDCGTVECCLDAGFCRWTVNGPRCEEAPAACQDTGTICRFLTPGGGLYETCCGENTKCPPDNVCP